MVAQLLRLRVDLLAGEVRGGARRSVGVVLGSVVALAVVLWAASVLGGLRTADPVVARTIVVLLGTAVTLGCTLVPLALGVADQLDPRRFAAFGIARRDLVVGLGIAGLVGLPVVAVAVLAVAQVVTWSRGAGPALLGVVAAVLVVATTALVIRVCSTLGAVAAAGRRVRAVTWSAVVVVVLLAVPTVSLLLRLDWLDPAGPGAQRLADIAGWTPWGAAWSVPADAATGDVGTAVAKLLVALVVVAVLALAWWALVGRLLVTVARPARVRRHRSLGWFDPLGSTPFGAVAARALTYWARDPRYRSSYLILVFVPLVVLPLGVAGVPWAWTALVPLPLMALIAGFLPHNDVSYDNTAVWLHVASGAPGWTDRLGRLVPLVVVGAPLLVAGAAVSARLYGDMAAFPLLVAVSASGLLGGLGLSSIVSVALPYPTVRPGDHPFHQPQAAGATATVAQTLMVLGTLLCMAPAGWIGLRALLGLDHPSLSLVLGVGIGVGVVVLVIGVLVGGAVFDRRGPDLLAAAQRN
ncbi:ABC-2 type transport system permease protein [Curtobacterium flaccumfaciens]|uniref:ABC-2 type transport system permease protein n=1 Tax=Curtobacterium salicis TaxID=1779862 RepID=A0ABX0T4U3_9MICO|nr:ABC transporter permease [Curtobacterium sp. WW7]NII40500.1 ABC-2 type transport system permease protein [Curtobacterium sp. WW7]